MIKGIRFIDVKLIVGQNYAIGLMNPFYLLTVLGNQFEGKMKGKQFRRAPASAIARRKVPYKRTLFPPRNFYSWTLGQTVISRRRIVDELSRPFRPSSQIFSASAKPRRHRASPPAASDFLEPKNSTPTPLIPPQLPTSHVPPPPRATRSLGRAPPRVSVTSKSMLARNYPSSV